MFQGEKVAELSDCGTQAIMYRNGDKYQVAGYTVDGVSPPVLVQVCTHLSLSQAIKWMMLFYVQEWENVQRKDTLYERMAKAISPAL